MNNLSHLIQQAQKIQGHFKQMQLQLEDKRVEATSGGGMVRAVVNGKQEVLEIKIGEEMSKITGGVGLPGFLTNILGG